MNRSPTGFTLIELLVVITIIVVLLALLAPAMDQAIYQAELAVCGTNLKGIATGVSTYAMENNRLFPYRPTTAEMDAGSYISTICKTGDPPDLTPYDDRPYLRRAMSLKNLLDPLSAGIDLERPRSDGGNWVISNYALWFGVKYPEWAGGGNGIRRMGDRLEWTDASRNQVRKLRISVLASDMDAILPWAVLASASHPEIEEPYLMRFLAWQEVPDLNTVQTFSNWRVDGRWDRSPIDANFVYTDGSVVRYNRVEWNDDRMARVPVFNGGSWQNEDTGGMWQHLPPQ